MWLRNLCSYLGQGLSWLIWTGLVIALVFFVRDILTDYASHKTTERIYTEKVTRFDLPAILVCFEPPYNTSALEKYNLSYSDVTNYSENLSSIEKSWLSFKRDIMFKGTYCSKHKFNHIN